MQTASEHQNTLIQTGGYTPVDRDIDSALTVQLPPTGLASSLKADLERLQVRALAQRVHVAIVGQFKRGKSTLLNALLGCTVLPFAVTPLTAIATYIQYGPTLKVRSDFRDGTNESIDASNTDVLRALLAERVTESGNPNNHKGLLRVYVDLPQCPGSIVFIDTPGVGSTYQHNTRTAHETLPECDAALFVVSPDPPITEIELDYLTAVLKHARQVVVVLNKIDLVDDADRLASERFLRATLCHAGLEQLPILSLSARAALASSQNDMAATGLPALQTLITTLMTEKGSTLLDESLRIKSRAIIARLLEHLDQYLAALQMPAARLKQQITAFQTFTRQAQQEENALVDRVRGDRDRLLTALDLQTESLKTGLRRETENEVARRVGLGETESAIVSQLGEAMPMRFSAMREISVGDFTKNATEQLHSHQIDAQASMERVRQTAAGLLDLSYQAPEPEESITFKIRPYWVEQTRETLFPASASFYDGLLPKSLRDERARSRILLAADELITRNAENLRWSIRRGLEDGFRAFETDLVNALRQTRQGSAEAMAIAFERQSRAELDTADEYNKFYSARLQFSDILTKPDKDKIAI